MSIATHRDHLKVFSLVLFEVAVVAVLHAIGDRPDIGIGWRDAGGWLVSTPADLVLISLVWFVALVLGWWTLGSTVLYLAMRAVRFRAGMRVAERLALPMVRRVVDRAIATTLVTSALLGPAAPALAVERSAGPAQQMVAATQYEPEPAGTEGAGEDSEQGGLGPGPQRRAPRPVRSPSLGGEEAEAGGEEPTPMERGEADRVAEALGSATDVPRPRSEPPDRYRPQPASGREAGGRAAGEERSAGEGDRSGAEDGSRGGAGDRAGGEHDADGDGSGADAADASDGDGGDGVSGDDGREETAVTRGSDALRPGATYTVRAGDHLWNIAARVVAADGGPGDRSAVATYWAELVRVTTPHLRSGDPNLIYPGEELELPPLVTGGRR